MCGSENCLSLSGCTQFTFDLKKKYLVYIGEPQEEIIEQYKSMFGKISTPTKKLIL